MKKSEKRLWSLLYTKSMLYVDTWMSKVPSPWRHAWFHIWLSSTAKSTINVVHRYCSFVHKLKADILYFVANQYSWGCTFVVPFSELGAFIIRRFLFLIGCCTYLFVGPTYWGFAWTWLFDYTIYIFTTNSRHIYFYMSGNQLNS